jgi:hypothetical protein
VRERVGRRRFIAVVVLREGGAVVLGRRGPRVTACVVGYGRRIVHDVWSTSDWSRDMRMGEELHLLETMTSACPRPALAKSRGPRTRPSCARLLPLYFSTNSPKVVFCFCSRSLICLLSGFSSGMLLRSQWPCRRLHHNVKSLASITARSFASSTPHRDHLATSKTRNIGIIAHIDAVRRNIYS